MWHGTDLPSALDIMENGINPAKLGKIGIFFTAEHDFVAQSFASATAGPTGELQALVETFMPAQVFETLQAQGHITEEPLNQYATVNEIRVHPGAFDAYDNSPKRLWKQEGNLLKPQDC